MKVSIITTCLNRVNTIGKAIESVLAQDFPDIEYIVIDGGSTDGSLDVIRRYADRLAVLRSEPDNGMYEAINKGIRLATGEVVGLVHSDDELYDRHVLSDVVSRLQHSGADMVYGNGVYLRGSRVVRNWVSGPLHRWKLRMGWLPLHPTCYIRRTALDRWGLYDERYHIAADTELLLRYLYQARIPAVYMPRYIVRMSMGGLSTSSQRRHEMWREDVAVYRSMGLPGRMMKIMKMAWKIPQFITTRKHYEADC